MSDALPALRRVLRGPEEIAAELRREFQLAFQQRTGGQPAATDPVLATLFHALAVQLGRVYDEAERAFPTAVIDDLVSVLGFPPRLAHPAQTVVAFSGLSERERISPETQLVGYARTGEQIGFTPDGSIELAPIRLMFAAVHEDGRLATLPGASLSESLPVPPATAALAQGGAPPTVYLAFDTDAGHLSGLGLFLDALPPGGPVATALGRSPWQILNAEAQVVEEHVLRPEAGRAGVRYLRWFHGEDAGPDIGDVARAVDLGAGPYGSAVFVFPPVPADRRQRSRAPRTIAATVPRLLPEGQGKTLDRDLVWVQIPLPPGTRGVATAVQTIAVNAITASNLDIWSDQVFFNQSGQAVALRPESEKHRFVMGVLSVTGEGGSRYVEASDVGAPAEAGRWRYRDGRFEFRPGKQATGRLDGYAMVRLLLCDGARGNGLDVGDVRRISSRLANVTAQVKSLTVSRGGTPPPESGEMRLRFADLLRNRDRVVTAADFDIAARSAEPRIVSVLVAGRTEVRDGALRPVEEVTLRLNRDDFADPEVEFPRLADRLQRYLQDKAVLGHHVRVLIDATA